MISRLACAALLATAARGQTPAVPQGAGAILQELHAFRQTATVLYVAAHPDDEDTQLIAYFAQGRGYRTGYLSLTRGEGGQNLIGGELGDELGVIRTQELLAARRVDGGRQFFTLARDFGYSKDYQQTLRRWDRAEVLADMVRVIRTFRPDVLITRFPPQASETHGHHTASAVLAVEAFRAAGDPRAMPERLAGLAPWQPRRVLWDAFRPGFRPGPPSATATGRTDIGGYNPLLGQSYGEIAARSRSMHRTQGFGSLGNRGSRPVFFQLLAGELAPHDPFDGIATTWARYPGGAAIDAAAAAAESGFDPHDPARSVPPLLALRDRLDALPGAGTDPVIVDRRAGLNRIVQACLGLYVDAAANAAEAVPGTSLSVHRSIVLRSATAVSWLKAGHPEALRNNLPVAYEEELPVPADQAVTQPYWLRLEESPGMFHVAPADAALVGTPENAPALTVHDRFAVAGRDLEIETPVQRIVALPDRGEVRNAVGIVPPVSLAFSQPVALVAPGGTVEIPVRITPNAGGAICDLRVVGHGQDAAPPRHMTVNGPRTERFTVAGAAAPGTTDLSVVATVGGREWTTDRVDLRYPHIPDQLLQPPARMRLVTLHLAVTARRVGYVAGAGDAVADCLALMGCSVVPLRPEELTEEHLRGLDAVVLGIRAFNTQPALPSHLDALFAYATAGGTVVVQYNTPNELKTERLGPYPLTLNRNLPHHRITDESSPVTLLQPEHPALTRPNRIGPDDFQGWVQERGLNFPDTWDDRYQPLLSSFDPGEAPQTGALLAARCGRGWYVYTGLSFFRQLPAGVPGAYRLFANLISLRGQVSTLDTPPPPPATAP